MTLVGYNQGLTTNQRKPLFNEFGWTQSTRYSGNDSSSHYEALQVKYNKRFSDGLQVLAHYTFSKAMDFDSNQYIYNRAIGYGPSSDQRPQEMVVTALYQLPIGRGKPFLNNMPRALDYLVGGWQLNVVNSWMTGLPFTPGYTDCGSDEDVSGECRANVVGNWQVADPSQYGWFAVCPSVMASNGETCGPWQRPQRGTIGNVGRNVLWGPHFWETDFSAFKEIAIRERLHVQIRGEAFNFLNHVNLGQPVSTVDAPNTAGRIFGTAGTYIPEIWQLGLRLTF